MPLIGTKNNIDLYNNLLKNLIPKKIHLYVEPFGGEFGLFEIMKNKPDFSVYNDMNTELYEEMKNRYFTSDHTIYFFNKDYKEVIQNYNVESTFFFFDPPYYRREHYYENHTFLTKEHHIELSEIIKGLKGKFLLSYQDRPLMRELYKDYNFHEYTGSNMFHIPEIAITNY